MKDGHPESREGPLLWSIVHTEYVSVINQLVRSSFASFRMTAQRELEC
jgi:hypothetical protein